MEHYISTLYTSLLSPQGTFPKLTTAVCAMYHTCNKYSIQKESYGNYLQVTWKEGVANINIGTIINRIFFPASTHGYLSATCFEIITLLFDLR